jgi:mannose-6-phosphate isomerase-like protein (cupin superfamily)
MKVLAGFAVALLAARAASAVTPKGMDRESHHEYVLGNRFGDIARLVLKPGDATELHDHRHDFFSVAIDDGQVSEEVAGKAPVVVKLHAGQVRFTEGGVSHVVRNVGKAPVREIVIELEDAARAHEAAPLEWEDTSRVHTAGGARREILFVKNAARISSLFLPPGAAEPPREHVTAQAIVALGDLDLNKGEPIDRLATGEVTWSGGRYATAISNHGRKPAKMVLLEFK